jgi:Fe2+ transport system protein FeoA
MAWPLSYPVPLSDLPVGKLARLHAVDLDDAAAGLLRALGLTSDSDLRLCKGGEPCIVQIGGTRLGVSGAVARHILVMPVPGGAD